MKIADIILCIWTDFPPHLFCHPFLQAVIFVLSWFYGGFLTIMKCKASSSAAQPPGAIIQLFS